MAPTVDNGGTHMRRTIASVTSPSRWRRRRAIRVVVAGALVVAAPFVGSPGSADPGGPSGHPDTALGERAGIEGTERTRTTAGEGDTSGPEGGHAAPRVVPVPLADPTVADLLSPGDLVDLVGAAAADPDPTPVARAALVIDTPVGPAGTRSVLVEVPESAAARLAATAAGTPLAVILHG